MRNNAVAGRSPVRKTGISHALKPQCLTFLRHVVRSRLPLKEKIAFRRFLYQLRPQFVLDGDSRTLTTFRQSRMQSPLVSRREIG